MLKHALAMRVMAENYLRMAAEAADPRERRKFLDYASVYTELSNRSAGREKSAAAEDKEREGANRQKVR